MLNKVIGIISYFPNNKEIREHRKYKLEKLIIKCNEIFNLPILIVAQNWTKEEINNFNNNVIIHSYNNPLGITGARKELRRLFLVYNYDYIIMLDDDCTLEGDYYSGNEYKKQIDEHPNMCGIFNDGLLKLFAISKYLFSKYDYDDINPENGDGFEDIIYIEKIKRINRDSVFYFAHRGLYEISDSTRDKYSTWDMTLEDKIKMRIKTLDYIKDKT